MTVIPRAYTDNDLDMVSGWAEKRGKHFHPALLSKTGFIAMEAATQEPLAAAWVYLLFDVPLAQIDNFYTRPGLNGAQARQAWICLEEVSIAWLKELKDPEGNPLRYPVLKTFANQRLATSCRALGWEVSPDHYVQIIKLI